MHRLIQVAGLALGVYPEALDQPGVQVNSNESKLLVQPEFFSIFHTLGASLNVLTSVIYRLLTIMVFCCRKALIFVLE